MPPISGCEQADLDDDGDIDCQDRYLFLGDWPDPVGPPSIAECAIGIPALGTGGSAVLLGLAALLFAAGLAARSIRRSFGPGSEV